jgi:hypothetical protein
MMTDMEHLKRIYKNTFCVAFTGQQTYLSEILENQGADFLKGLHFRKISYDLASIFRGRRSTLDRWSGKIAKCIGTKLSILYSIFHF